MIGIRQMLEYFSARRLRVRARQIAALAGDTLATVYPRRIEREEEKRRVLLLTPHADDETFGAGGMLLRHHDAGADMSILLVSDNVASIDDSGIGRTEKQRIREEEFRSAMEHVPRASLTLLGIGDDGFSENSAPPAELLRACVEFQPDVLYLPSLFDNHRDHRVLNYWLLELLRTVPHFSPLIRGYEVWSPLPATAVADISEQLERKRGMMRCYASQLQAIDYEHHVLGLNAYRSMTFGGRNSRYAEAFLELPSNVYLALGSSLFHT